MVQKVAKTQTDTGTWAADTSIRTALEKTGLITRIDATVEVTPSATLTGANQQDGNFRVIQNLTIEGGSDTYFTLPADDAAMGGTLLHFANIVDGHGVGHSDGAITAPSRTYQPINFVLHAGTRPRVNGRDNPFDLTAFIPAQIIGGNVNAVWVTSGNDVMDDAVTITSAVMRFTVHQVNGEHADLVAEMQRQGVVLPGGATGMVPAWEATVNAHTATATAYADEINVPVGGWLARILYACQDATATRSLRAADEVVGLALKYTKDTKTPIQVFLDYLMAHGPAASNLTANSGAAESGGTEKMSADFNLNALKGMWAIDLRPFANGMVGDDYGLDMTSFSSGDWHLGRTINTYAAGDDSLIIWEKRKAIYNRLS